MTEIDDNPWLRVDAHVHLHIAHSQIRQVYLCFSHAQLGFQLGGYFGVEPQVPYAPSTSADKWPE